MMTLLLSLLLMLSPSDSNLSNLHPVHVSITNIEYNEQASSLEVSCRAFTDDFEKTLRKVFKSRVDLLNPVEKQKMDSLAAVYITSRLRIAVNGVPVDLKYLGYEQDEDGIMNYLEVTGVEPVKKIDVKNTLLYDLLSKQSSVIHVTVGGKRKSTRMTNPASEAFFQF